MTKTTTKTYSDMVITSMTDFEAIIDEFENSCNVIRNIIDNEQKNCNKLTGTGVWQGKAADSIIEKYALLNSNYEQIDYSLQIYTGFLRKTAEDYKLLLEEQDKNIEAMANSLDVNS